MRSEIDWKLLSTLFKLMRPLKRWVRPGCLFCYDSTLMPLGSCLAHPFPVRQRNADLTHHRLFFVIRPGCLFVGYFQRLENKMKVQSSTNVHCLVSVVQVRCRKVTGPEWSINAPIQYSQRRYQPLYMWFVILVPANILARSVTANPDMCWLICISLELDACPCGIVIQTYGVEVGGKCWS